MQANGFMADRPPLYADASTEGKTANVGAIAAHSVGTLKAVCNHVTAYTKAETIGEYKVSWTLTQQN